MCLVSVFISRVQRGPWFQSIKHEQFLSIKLLYNVYMILEVCREIDGGGKTKRHTKIRNVSFRLNQTLY